MALFGTPNSFVGIDIGTSSLKLVELTNRKKRIEVTAYAQTAYPNPLVAQDAGDEVVKETATIISRMITRAGISSDVVVAALPGSAVFSTVISMPKIPEAEMEKAIQFAAKNVVPADLEDVVLGYSRLGEDPHMETDDDVPATAQTLPATSNGKGAVDMSKNIRGDVPVPVFITAAPKYLVDRYVALMRQLRVKLHALELETFPLVRSLFSGSNPSALIVDIGDRTTTFHIIDRGAPRVSHTMDLGGYDITTAIKEALSVPQEKAEEVKSRHGIAPSASEDQKTVVSEVVQKQINKARDLLNLYSQQANSSPINQTVLIGGGANLPGLTEAWAKGVGHKTSIGNPWRGLSYPDVLEKKLRYLGPTYGVAVGLALRGFTK